MICCRSNLYEHRRLWARPVRRPHQHASHAPGRARPAPLYQCGARTGIPGMMKAAAAMLPLLAALLFSPAAMANEALALMQEVYEQGRIHKSQRMDMELIVKDRKNRERKRLFRMLYRINDAETRSLLRFYRPADIKGTGLFNIVYAEDRENDQWIYFPAFRRINQLSTEEKHQSFMGSDFTNADIAGRKPSDDIHTLISADEQASVVSSVPRDPNDSYSRIESHVINRIKVLRKIVFYDREGRKLKTMTSKRIAQREGMYSIVEAEMINHQSGGSTVMIRKSLDFADIDPGQLTVAKLRNR